MKKFLLFLLSAIILGACTVDPPQKQVLYDNIEPRISQEYFDTIPHNKIFDGAEMVKSSVKIVNDNRLILKYLYENNIFIKDNGLFSICYHDFGGSVRVEEDNYKYDVGDYRHEFKCNRSDVNSIGHHLKMIDGVLELQDWVSDNAFSIDDLFKEFKSFREGAYHTYIYKHKGNTNVEVGLKSYDLGVYQNTHHYAIYIVFYDQSLWKRY